MEYLIYEIPLQKSKGNSPWSTWFMKFPYKKLREILHGVPDFEIP